MMSETGMKQVHLTSENLKDKETMSAVMRASLDIPDYFGGNLDALADILSEITQETVFEIDIADLESFSEDGYAQKALKVISRVCEENPHLHLYLTDQG